MALTECIGVFNTKEENVILPSLKLYCQEQRTGHTFKNDQLKINVCHSLPPLVSTTHRTEILGGTQTFLYYITKYTQIKVQFSYWGKKIRNLSNFVS